MPKKKGASRETQKIKSQAAFSLMDKFGIGTLMPAHKALMTMPLEKINEMGTRQMLGELKPEEFQATVNEVIKQHFPEAEEIVLPQLAQPQPVMPVEQPQEVVEETDKKFPEKEIIEEIPEEKQPQQEISQELKPQEIIEEVPQEIKEEIPQKTEEIPKEEIPKEEISQEKDPVVKQPVEKNVAVSGDEQRKQLLDDLSAEFGSRDLATELAKQKGTQGEVPITDEMKVDGAKRFKESEQYFYLQRMSTEELQNLRNMDDDQERYAYWKAATNAEGKEKTQIDSDHDLGKNMQQQDALKQQTPPKQTAPTKQTQPTQNTTAPTKQTQPTQNTTAPTKQTAPVSNHYSGASFYSNSFKLLGDMKVPAGQSTPAYAEFQRQAQAFQTVFNAENTANKPPRSFYADSSALLKASDKYLEELCAKKELTPDELTNMHALHELKTMQSLSRNGTELGSIEGDRLMTATRIVSGNIPADKPSQGLIENTDPVIRSLNNDKVFQSFALEDRAKKRTMSFEELQKAYEEKLSQPQQTQEQPQQQTQQQNTPVQNTPTQNTPTQQQPQQQPQQPQPLSNEEFAARFNQLQETMATLQKQMADLQKLNPNLKGPEAPKQEAPKQEAPKQEAPKQEAPKQEAPKKKEAPKAPQRPAWVQAKAKNTIHIDPFYTAINSAVKGVKNTKKIKPGLEKFAEHLKTFNKNYQTNLKNTKEQRKIYGDALGMSADAFRRELAPALKEGKRYQAEAFRLGTSLGETELNNLAAITQLETMDTLAANNIAPDSREGLTALLASKLAFENNRQDLAKCFEQNKEDPLDNSYFSRIQHMCNPRQMQENMKQIYNDPLFKDVVKNLDETQMKAYLDIPGSEFKKKYDAYRDKQAEQAMDKKVYAQPGRKTPGSATPRTIPITDAHKDLARIEANALAKQLPSMDKTAQEKVRKSLLPMALAYSVGKDAIQSIDMRNGNKAQVDLRKSLADVMAFKVIQEGVKHQDPDFLNALGKEGGVQLMEETIKKNNVFRDMVRVDTPEAAETLINNASNDKTLFRLAYNASHKANSQLSNNNNNISSKQPKPSVDGQVKTTTTEPTQKKPSGHHM